METPEKEKQDISSEQEQQQQDQAQSQPQQQEEQSNNGGLMYNPDAFAGLPSAGALGNGTGGWVDTHPRATAE